MLKRTVLSLIAAVTIALTAPVTAIAQEATMPALPTPATSGYADVNGIRLWYQTYGEGDPLVLIHGGFGAVEMFGPNIAALAAGRRVIGVDLQAHGRTGPLGRPMTFEAMATDIAELITSLGYEKADVMGYSMGGGVALRLAIDHPELVDKLVVVSTAFAFSNWHDYNQQGMRGIAAAPEQAAEGMKQSPMFEMYKQIAPGGEASWPAAVAEVAALVGKDFDWSAEVPAITAPTLIVLGDWDSVRIAAATEMFELLGGGAQDGNWDRSGMNQNRFAVLPNLTHYEIFMAPALAAAVIPFLDDDATSHP